MASEWSEPRDGTSPSREKRRAMVLLRGVLVVAVGALLLDAGIEVAGVGALGLVVAFALTDLVLAFAPLDRVARPGFELWVGAADLLLVGIGMHLAGVNGGALPVSCLLMALVVALGHRRANAVAGAAAVSALHAWLLLRAAPDGAVGRHLVLHTLFLCSVGLYYGVLAGHIHRSRTSVELDRFARRELATLLEILGDVTSSLDLREVTSSVVRKLTDVVPAVRCSIVWIDERARRCFVLASHDDPDIAWFELDLDKYPEIRKAFATRQPVIIPDVTSDPLMAEVRQHLTGLDFQSIIVLPITFGGDVLGGLCLRTARGNRSFTDREVNFLTAAARASANSLKNAMLHRQAVEESRRHRDTGEKLARILNHSPELILTTDTDGAITEFNRGAEVLLGYSRREVLGRPCTLLLEETPGSASVLDRVLEAEVLPCHAERVRAKDGSVLDVEMHLSVLRNDDGEIAGTVWIGRDVSELKAAQRQLVQAEKLSSIGEVISGVAHELNNPLSGVLGFSQLLLSRYGDTPMVRELEKVYESAERCHRIVKNLLSFSRAHKPERKYLGLNGILEKTLDLRQYPLHVNDVEVVRRFDPDLPLTMMDFNQIQQVFLNLLINAQQAMAAVRGRSRRLVIRTYREGGFIRAEISDNGEGMSERVLERIFDPFFTTKQQGEGTGLGLSVSYGIVKEHGGRIWAHSRPGEGATFTVELPVYQEPRTALQAPASHDSPPPGDHPRGHILVVDDEPLVVDLLIDVLEEAGHRVDTAANGDEACRKVDARDYDMVITDVRMPRMDGMDFYRRVLSTRPELARRVVFVTGDLIDRGIVDFLADVPARALPKPIEIDRLHQVVREILDPDSDYPEA